HREHELTVFDLDPARLARLSNRFDVAIVEGNGASRRTLQEAGIADVDLLIACTARDETNLIAAIFARGLSSRLKTIVRTTDVEYLDVWRQRQLDVDFIVSSELETAHAISRIIGVPAARQTDVFADGQVQIVEFEIEEETRADVVGVPLREAAIPADSKVAAVIRGERVVPPRGSESLQPGDRIVVIGSPQAAREWSRLLAPSEKRVRDLVVFGGGSQGAAIADLLLSQGIAVRIVEIDRERALELADRLPDARVYCASALDPDFLERERIGAADAAVFSMHDDAKNLYGATLARLHGVPFTISIVNQTASADVFEAGGIDVSVNPRHVAAEEIVRFAHDPRTLQVAMFEGDRYEILDITVRPQSRLVGVPFRELPMTGAVIGAIVRNGTAIFPHGDSVLEPGDRAIIFTEAGRVREVESAL
ncbi:MAG TPA: Trk system potassium transporter TrkA, partial [Gaiellaceae bacterium]|nr:Trk system potassium transporter TrkA [Gaiellaceae bacterium]